MKRFFLSFLLLVVLQTSFSQKVYFIYLQSEQEQPFFVKLNDKVYSSTALGYLILSKLHDSTYTFNIGFVENKWPEQRFSVMINKKDHGYLLKNFGEKGWGLFDLQTLAVQMAISPVSNNGTSIKTEKKEVSEFTEILSRAADDSTLREKQVLVKEEKKPVVSVQDVVKKEENKPDIKPVVESKEQKIEKNETAIKKEEKKPDEKTIINSEEPKIEKKNEPGIKKEESRPTVEQPYKRSVVTRKSESSTTAGLGLMFIDDYQNGFSDTISILIPNPKPLLTAVKEEPREEKKFLNISSDTTKKENENLQIKKEETVITDKKIKNNCEQVAEENDFLTLRKNMAAKNDDDEMIDEAKKYFKTKCFTSLQIKNLSVLFLNDAGKYKFFDLAYSYVSDPDNFGSLQSELKDEYYINRFKAMIRLL